MPDIVTRQILKVEGQEEIERLNKELEQEREHLVKLQEIQKQGVVGVNPQDIRDTAQNMVDLEKRINQLRGTTGFNGQGFLGVSYAAQDFISVISTDPSGRGLGRALGAISNNVPQIVAALGMGATGLGGAISIATAAIGGLIPVVEKWWGVVADKDKAKEAKDILDELEKRIEGINEAYEKLTEKPTKEEDTRLKRLGEALAQPGVAGRAEAALAAGLPAEAGIAMLTPEERDRMQQAIANAGMARTAEDMRRFQEQALLIQQTGARRRAREMLTEAVRPGAAGRFARAELVTAMPELGAPPPTEQEREHQAQQAAAARQQVQERIRRDVTLKNKELEAPSKRDAEFDREKKKDDAEWLRQDRQQIQAEIRRQQHLDAQNDHLESIRRRDQEQRQRNVFGRAGVQMSQQLGYGTPSPAQARDLSEDIGREYAQTQNLWQAAYIATQRKMAQIRDRIQRDNQLLQMPANNGAPGF